MSNFRFTVRKCKAGNTGSAHTPLPTQAAMMMLLLNHVPHAAIHRLLQSNHEAIEDMQKRLYTTSVPLGFSKRRRTFASASLTEWSKVSRCSGTMVRHHSARPAFYFGTSPPYTTTWQGQSSGPGPVRKVEWKPLAQKWLQGRQIILHTDSAKSYKLQVPDVLRDRVVHKKKRVKVGTKFRWIAPKYVEMQRRKVPGSKKVIKCKSGTQFIDRCWKFLKERLNINQHTRVGSQFLKLQLRSAQYEYWRRGQDLWIDTGVLVQWFLASTVQAAG